MGIFSATMQQMLFLFTIIVIGFVLAKCNILPKNAAGVLAKLENTVFIPALVMGTFIQNFTVERLGATWKLFLASFALMVVVLPLAIFIPKLLSKDDFVRKIYTYGLAFSNFGFMGNSVVAAIFPDLFWKYLIFTLPLWILIYLWGVPVLLMPGVEKGQPLKERTKAFLNPMFIGMLVGMVIGLLKLPLPDSITNVVTTLGNCMSPVAMLLTGITVAGIKFRETFSNVSIYAVSLIRLLAIPLVFIGVFALLPLPEDFVVCAVCSLAMPLGLNTIVIPSAYGRDPSVASGMALISHLLSCATIPFVFLLLTYII